MNRLLTARIAGTFRTFLSSAILASCALATTGYAETTITVTQTSDAQPINILPVRAGNTTWVKNVFESLFSVNPSTFDIEPLLATSYTLADDGLSMDIQLRDDVTFHTGRKMTAEDVKFTFETAADPKSAAQTGFIARKFSAIDITGEYSLKITFTETLSSVWDFFEEAHIIDKETYDKREDGSQVIGTGPYKFSSWTPGASIILNKYDGYRDPNVASIDEIEVAVITDPTASIAALRSGRSVVAIGLTPRDTAEFSRNPQYTISPAGGIIFPMGVNITMPPFDKKEVRQAIGYAVDRQRINDQIFDGTGTPTALFWAPGSPGYTEEAANHYSYDPEKAKAMIEEAGASGAEVEIILPAIPTNQSIFEIVQNNLKNVGLEPVAKVLDVGEYDGRQVAGDLGPAFILVHGQVGLGASTLINSLPSLREGNPSAIWNEQYIALRDAVTGARDNEELATAVSALSDYMIDEAFNLALVQSQEQVVISEQMSDLQMSRRGHLIFANAKLAE